MTFGIGAEATKIADDICRIGRSLFERRLTFGSTGNISARLSDGTTLMTPTNVSLGDLDPGQLSHISHDGQLLGGEKPTKEAFLHRCMYCARDNVGAVVHLHSTYSVALSIRSDVDSQDVLPPLTAYYAMRVGRLPLIPYFAPGDKALALAVKDKAANHRAVLLANHGPVVSGTNLREAQYATEELEETARLFLMLEGKPIRPLSSDQVAGLKVLFG